MTWRRHATLVGIGVLGTLLGVMAWIALVDPYQVIPFSPPLDREPIARDKRLALPGLARKPAFDSAIIGSSTTRLLRPSYLNSAFGVALANLSIDGSVPSDHARMLALFLAHHPAPKLVIVGVDYGLWCHEDRFPPAKPHKLIDRLYDDAAWLSLTQMLNWDQLTETGEQFAYVLGLVPQKWGKDGYTAWPPPERYNAARAHQLIYPDPPIAVHPLDPRHALPADRAAWRYDTLTAWHAPMMASLPPQTLKIVLFPPAHRQAFPPAGSPAAERVAECKRRVAEVAARLPNAHVLDFAFDSALTRVDSDYLDQTHVTIAAAERFQAALVEAVQKRKSRPDYYAYVDLDGLR